MPAVSRGGPWRDGSPLSGAAGSSASRSVALMSAAVRPNALSAVTPSAATSQSAPGRYPSGEAGPVASSPAARCSGVGGVLGLQGRVQGDQEVAVCRRRDARRPGCGWRRGANGIEYGGAPAGAMLGVPVRAGPPARGLRPLGELLGVQASWGPAASSTAAVGSSIEHRSAEVGYPELDDAEAGQA